MRRTSTTARGARGQSARRGATGIFFVTGDDLLPDQGRHKGDARLHCGARGPGQPPLPRLQTSSLPLNDKLEGLVKRLGEPMLSEFAPEELNAEMAHIGWAELESLPPSTQAHRYLQDRSAIVAPPPNFAFALFAANEASSSRYIVKLCLTSHLLRF